MRGTIRKGLSDDQKQLIASRMEEPLAKHGGLASTEDGAGIRETPASWMLENGKIMPEPGEEDAWFEAHKKKPVHLEQAS